MNISKISRTLVVIVFVTVIIIIGSQSIYLNFNSQDTLEVIEASSVSRLIYVILLLTFFIMYAVIKSKFSKKRIVKKLSLLYRYIYLITITLIIKIISINLYIEDINVVYIILCSIIGTISAVCIKKIIYNVSKSDMLSVLGMFMFALLPNILNDSIAYVSSICINLVVLLYIVFMQKLIDELKQPKIKTLKYIRLSLVVGVLMGLSMLTSICSYIYLIILVAMLFVTSNLDKTNINIPNKMISKLRQKNKEMLYSIERIYINKKYISVIIMLAIGVICFYSLGTFINGIDSNCLNCVFKASNSSILDNVNKVAINLDFNSIVMAVRSIAANARVYYTVLIVYILLLELLTAYLRRSYDTKSTILKTLFILLVVFSVIFNYNTYVFYQLYTVLLILIAITNTSNIYLNRDERIKLLN